MGTRTSRAMLAITVLLTAGMSAGISAEITISDDFRIDAPGYQGQVGLDGCFTSLKVEGLEFLSSAESFPRGAYLYQGGILRLDSVEKCDENAIIAKSEAASVRYEFGSDTMTWSLTNNTEKDILLVVVLVAEVKAAADGQGLMWKAPLSAGWTRSAWYQDKARLDVDGTTKVWGPWGGGRQVLQTDIAPGKTREVKLQMSKAPEEEAARAKEIASKEVEPPKDPEGPMWDLEKLSVPPKTYPAPGFEEEGLKALFFEGPPFRGRPTRVFAWVGLPEMKPGEKVPGMVLVHGGGGTAFARWARVWTKRGYAAISMDTCGSLPTGDHGQRPRHDDGGPWGWGGFDQIDWPREDQWTYHAVADAILAHSLLRSMPEVDADRIGLTGISWGGYLTSILAGVDTRFKFAVPVYGCGYYLDTTFGTSVRGLGGERTDRWMRWWDPSNYLKNATMPICWVTGSNDFAYWFSGLQESYRAVKGPVSLAVRLRMPHGHGPAGEDPEEIHAFANSFLKGGKPMAKITGQGRDGDAVWASFESEVPVVKAELNYTKATGAWPEREWIAVPATIDGGKVTATLPEGTTVYYINIFDERDLCVSTQHEELTTE